MDTNSAKAARARPPRPSPTEMNRQHHREFWEREHQKFERRAADSQLLALATEDINSEIVRSVPVYSQKTMELAFKDAERRRAAIRKGDGRKGGRPQRGDAVQKLIEEIVAARQDIPISALIERLCAMQHYGVMQDIEDDEILFTDASGAMRTAPISGLKDRLMRARKSVKSRKPVSPTR
jgi:hypothetical protein